MAVHVLMYVITSSADNRRSERRNDRLRQGNQVTPDSEKYQGEHDEISVIIMEELPSVRWFGCYAGNSNEEEM